MILRRLACLAVLTALALALPASRPAAAQQWQHVDRPGLGFAIDVPVSLFDLREAGRDGRSVTWRTYSDDIRLRVFSLPVKLRVSPDAVLPLVQDDFANREVTYEASGESWAVVSGYTDGTRSRIFYDRLEAGPGATWAGFSLQWQADRRDDVDPTVDRIANSLAVSR